jgi:hypothetical protein
MKYRITFALIMGVITTAVISFALIAINIGFNEKFVAAWLRSWSVSYVLAVASMLFIGPRVQLLVHQLLRTDQITAERKRKPSIVATNANITKKTIIKI